MVAVATVAEGGQTELSTLIGGTGTALGAPIEAAAQSTVLSEECHADAPLTLGAVKTNIGHLEGAAASNRTQPPASAGTPATGGGHGH
ncbi:hypothetical protein ACFWAT_15680 [Streptomyces syringium]|uniref:hypothetical protein n=1 Tax=Streptomyces syringium TaxID=76729 RepID=UPI0036583E09